MNPSWQVAKLIEANGRRPSASINFITAHDGFTLADLVSYNEKHNEANREDNHDGTDDNRSWNCGAEGPTDDPEVNRLRERQMRNFLATLFLSQGVPMLLAGDERCRTQHGNNNAYCQDNELSWLDWSLDERRSSLLEFTQRLIGLRQEHPVFRRSTFLGGVAESSGLPDVYWFRPDGRKMTRRDWDSGPPRLGVFLNGGEIDARTAQGEPVVDDSFLILFNAHHEEAVFTLPPRRFGTRWTLELSTSDDDAEARRTAREEVTLESRALCVFRRE